MSYRYHFYLLNKEEIEQITTELPSFSKFDANELLCIESCQSIWEVWKKCRPLFKKDTNAYNRYSEDYPCVVTKSRLREMVLAFHKEYQKHIIFQSIDVLNESMIPKDANELFRRCMHLGPADENSEKQKKACVKDERHSEIWGQFELHQQFLLHCTTDGFHAITEGSSPKFKQLLDDPLRMNNGNTMYDILVQLIYMYKTLSPSKKLVICGW